MKIIDDAEWRHIAQAYRSIDVLTRLPAGDPSVLPIRQGARDLMADIPERLREKLNDYPAT